jgi:uncharacterized protein YeaO (DUF488 family)
MATRKHAIKLARVYEQPGAEDGVRVLVDRVWPRGVSKERAHVDEWLKQVAPSTGLRKWYGHNPERFGDFQRRYLDELSEPEPSAALQHLRDLARHNTVTLLTATKDVGISQAAVLADLLRHRS